MNLIRKFDSGFENINELLPRVPDRLRTTFSLAEPHEKRARNDQKLCFVEPWFVLRSRVVYGLILILEILNLLSN